jgi:hypothetical protein
MMLDTLQGSDRVSFCRFMRTAEGNRFAILVVADQICWHMVNPSNVGSIYAIMSATRA